MNSPNEYVLTITGQDPYRYEAYYSVTGKRIPAPGKSFGPPKLFFSDGCITNPLGSEIVTFFGINAGDKIKTLSNDPERLGDNHAHPWAERVLRGSIVLALDEKIRQA